MNSQTPLFLFCRNNLTVGFLLISLLLGNILLSTGPGFPASVFAAPSWSNETLIAQDSRFDSKPSLLELSNGRVWLFYQALDGANGDVYLRTFDPASRTWSTAVQVTNDPAHDGAPSATLLRDGTVFLAWSSNRTGQFSIFSKTFNGVSWSAEAQLTTGTSADFDPSVVQAKDGRIWVFWQRRASGNMDIVYRTFDGKSWSPEILLTTSTSPDTIPRAAAFKDGSIWVVWQRTMASGDQEVFGRIYRNEVWGGEIQITFDSTETDAYPSVAVDRDGLVWIFWSREFLITGSNCTQGVCDFELMYKTTYDGVAFSSDTRLTSDALGKEKDQADPVALQISDRNLWLVYRTLTFTGNPEDPDEWMDIYLRTYGPIITHDVSIRSVLVPDKVPKSIPLQVQVTVSNLGDFAETLTLHMFARNETLIPIGTQTISLAPGESVDLNFNWDTTLLSLKEYALLATVSSVLGETSINRSDNRLVAGSTRILSQGDLEALPLWMAWFGADFPLRRPHALI